MTLFADPADFPHLAGGTPALVVLPGAAAPTLAGIAIWFATPREAGWTLSRDAAPPAPGQAPLPAAPAATFAILAPDPVAAADLAAAWGAAAPPILAAATIPWAELARLALGAIAARAAEAAGLQAALVAAREAAEDTRLAMAALLAGAGGASAPAAAVLVREDQALPDPAVADADGVLALAAMREVALQGLCAVGVRVAEAACGPGTMLRATLFGAESRRVHGAWRVPGAALRAGWLALDLPAALGPVRETTCLDLRAAVAPGDRLAIALAPEGGPALRLWSAPYGRRFVAAAHWDATAPGLALPLHGAPPAAVAIALPAAIWHEAGVAPPDVTASVGLGDRVARPAVMLPPGAAALIVLPVVPAGTLDILEARLAIPVGDAERIEAALWLQPAGVAPAVDADLTLLPPAARWSGWRRGGAAAAQLAVPLRLPLDPPPRAALVLSLRHDATATLPARIEWRDLVGFRETAALPPPPLRLPPDAPLAAAMPPGARPTVASVTLEEHFLAADGFYRHLDIAIDGLALGGLAWPRVRFKLAIGGDAPQLEFRLRPDWPAVFETWPGREADAHGPVWVVPATDLPAAMRRLATTDRHLLAALLEVLPGVVATAARQAATEIAEYRDWCELARRMAAAGAGS